MTRSDRRVVIVGAGIVGAACARALALDGWQVTIVDSRPVGSGSTAAGMGHIVVMDDSEAQFALCQRSRQLWEDLAPRLPKTVEYDRAGTLWVAADDEEMVEVLRKHAFYQDRNYEAEVLDSKALYHHEPNLRPGLVGGLRVPGDRVIYPPAAASWLLEQAVSLGASFQIRDSVQQIKTKIVEFADKSSIQADVVVLATGHLASNLVPGLPIRPRKGHLVITDRYPGLVNHQLIELGYLKSAHSSDVDSVAFNVQPRPTGQLLIGSSRQFGTDDPAVEPRMIERMLRRVIEYMPGLAKTIAIRAWTGFRAATPDSLPLIGLHPDLPWLMIAAGHEGLGITTSLATAELIADTLSQRPTAIPGAPYLPGRSFSSESHG